MTLLSRACVSPYEYSIETVYICIVSGIGLLSVKKRRDHKTRGRGRSRSLKVALFDRPYTTFYWSGIVSMALCYTIFELFDVE